VSENELYDIDLFGRVSGLHLLVVNLRQLGRTGKYRHRNFEDLSWMETGVMFEEMY
jgi:hypothetical protein